MARQKLARQQIMRHNTWRSALGMAAAAVLALCATPAFSHALADPPADAKKIEKPDLAKMEKRDLVIFRSGNKVEGVILDENDASVKMLVIVGSLRSEATYNKSEILEIKHNEFKPAEAAKTSDKMEDPVKPAEGVMAMGSKNESSANPYASPVDGAGKTIDAGALKVYVVKLVGEFGRDVSKTPIKAVMDDMAKAQPDVIVFQFDESFAALGEDTVDFDQQGAEGYTTKQLVLTLEIDTLITPRLRDDSAFAKKPRVVAWVKKALGGAAYLPLAFKEIYYASDAHHGGVGGLDHLFDNVGDEVVRQKQRSLRLAWVKGLAEEGEHDMRIAKAMCWGDYILSYRIVGGQVEFLEDRMPPSPEWFLLKDDGATNKDHADSMQDIVRMKGNDYLTLDAKTAFDIGLSRGTADTVDELMSKVGITRNYGVMKNKSGEILKGWSAEVNKAENELKKLVRAFRAVEVKPPGRYEQRTAARGERLRILYQSQALWKQYAESINPRRLGDPEGNLQQIDILIDRIKTEQTLDRRP